MNNKDTNPTPGAPEESASPAPKPKGTVTIAEILEDFKLQISTAMKAALESAYSQFVNDADFWTESNVESNTRTQTMEAIRQILAGEDPAHVTRYVTEYGFNQADKMRDMLWKQCAEPAVKKALEEKDKEIARLHEEVRKAWERRY